MPKISATVVTAVTLILATWLVYGRSGPDESPSFPITIVPDEPRVTVAEDDEHARIPVESERSLIAATEAKLSKEQDQAAPSDAPPKIYISEEEASDIRSNLDLLYADAGREDLLQGYKSVMQRLPSDFANKPHAEKLELGTYTTLVPADERGPDRGSMQIPASAGGSEAAFGLIRIHNLESGDIVKTEIDLNDLGEHASIAVEAAWFQKNIGSRR